MVRLKLLGKIEFDSRKIEKTYFVAIRGSVSDGMNIFKSNRIRAVTIVCDTFPVNFEKITYTGKDTNKALAFMAANYFGNHLKIKVGWYRNKREDYHLLYCINYLKAGLK
jgi:hypothetical protein